MRTDHTLKQEIVRREQAEEALRQFQAEFEAREELHQAERDRFAERYRELLDEIVGLKTNLSREISRRQELWADLARAGAEYQLQVDARDSEVTFTRALLKDEASQRRMAEDTLNRATKKLLGWVSELEQVNREMTLFDDLGKMLHSCLTKEDALAALSQHAPHLFSEDTGLVGISEPPHGVIQVVVRWGDGAAREQRFQEEDCWAIRRGRAHQVEDTREGLLCPHLPRPLPASYMCIPIAAQGTNLGIIHLSQQEPGHLSEAKQRAVAAVAEELSLALARSRFHHALLSQSIRDPLTRLFSRRFMEESLNLEISRATRTNLPLGVIMLEIDYFEDFNDALGSDTSDAILSEFAFLLQNSIRNEDIACRYGAWRFAVILPDTSLDVALDRTVQIREAVKSLNLFTGDRRVDEITLSCGVAVFPDNGASGEVLLDAAGEALSRAKQEGPDRVVIKP